MVGNPGVRWRRRTSQASPYLLAALLAAAGTNHFVNPAPYERIIPDLLPARRSIVYVSGVAELACAAALVPQRSRAAAGWATAGLFVLVFPANIQMALQGGADSGGVLGSPAVAWLRLPLQVPLVLWAVQVARSARPAVRGAPTP